MTIDVRTPHKIDNKMMFQGDWWRLGDPWGALGGAGGLLGTFGVAFGGPWKPLGRPRGPLQNLPEGHVDFDSCRCSQKCSPRVPQKEALGAPGG